MLLFELADKEDTRFQPAAGLAESAPAEKQRDLSHQELKLFYDLAQEMSNAHDHRRVISAFLDRLPAVVPFNCGAITLPAPQSGKYLVAYASGQRAELMKDREISVGEGATGWALANRRSFRNADPKLDLPPALAESFAAYRTLAVSPIIKGDDLLGVVTLYSSDLAAYTPDHERLLEEASRLLANALSATAEAFGAFPSDGVLRQTEPELQSELAH